jgi:hypothetical protein
MLTVFASAVVGPLLLAETLRQDPTILSSMVLPWRWRFWE